MSNFYSDLGQEKILSEYLDIIYKSKEEEFIRIDDIEKQHQGIDIIIKRNSREYYIDEKAQLHYVNSDLPTFTFELSYLVKNNILHEGWLFDKNKLTQYYFLITGIFLKENKNKLLHFEDIEKLQITSVNRQKLIKHLEEISLTKGKLAEYEKTIRLNNKYGKNPICELPHNNGLLYFTEHLEEKPINLQLRLKYLIECNVAKIYHDE